jgi:selenocysteine lyase/cysteine desulfurase
MPKILTTAPVLETKLEAHFKPFREQTIGYQSYLQGPYGPKKIIYADWIASGRLYQPIEEKLSHLLGPFVANTHTETSYTGALMTRAYAEARQIIKRHVNAEKNDVLLTTGTGMTGAVVKLQRILGLKLPEQFKERVQLKPQERPVVFISHMEHHSNQTSWLETTAEVVQIAPTATGELDLDDLERLLKKYARRAIKIASITSGSNVTGVMTPYHQVAEKMHAHGGLCFVDFACSGPYVTIDMNPARKEQELDAIFFSPHKFLGGPGSCGILVFKDKLYKNKVPDVPGGGTVTWTNPWGGHAFIADIELREDGGTPGFMQVIRAALAMQLKEKMGVAAIQQREKNMLSYLFYRLKAIKGLHVLAPKLQKRLGAVSFFIKDCHYNLVVSLLNDLYGIQTRGGCSCAGTYGHYLLEVSEDFSRTITENIDAGDITLKPGWVRLSLHPTMSNAELFLICDALEHVAKHWRRYAKDYQRVAHTLEFKHNKNIPVGASILKECFS